MKYRKKPVIVEATRWSKNGDHPRVKPYGNPPQRERKCLQCGNKRISHGHLWVAKIDAGQRICPGDWIITDGTGEHYPCKPDVFEATYEAVGELKT